MKNIIIKTVGLFLLLISLTPGVVKSQEDNTYSNSRADIIKVAREIISSAKTCALITLDKEGNPRVRAMQHFNPDEEFICWFGTNTKTGKVDQIKNDSRVTLYYLDEDESGYVQISGKAELVNDEKAKEKWWKKEWEAFYPDKKENYILIKVVPIWIEVVSNTKGIHGDSKSWKAPRVYFKSK